MIMDHQAGLRRRHEGDRADRLPWDEVDHVLLDMDGTLLDRHFDNHFFEEALPRRYGERLGLDFFDAKRRLLAMYQAVEDRLEWADLEYWTRTLGIDLIALSRECEHLIGYLPDSVGFLERLRTMGKRVIVVTNAHPGGIDIKTGRTGLHRHVHGIVGAFDLGFLKRHPEFWLACQRRLGFDPSRTLYVDDDESCLAAAQRHGIRFVIHSAKSSSRLPAEPSARFPFVTTLRDVLIP